MKSSFTYLFSPLQIGPIVVKNRIYFPPHGTGFIDHVNQEYTLPNERLAYYLTERAKGGASLVFLDLQAYHPTSYYGAANHFSCAWMEEIVPRYQMISRMVHKYDTKVFAQLIHVGGNAPPCGPDDPTEVWVPSLIPGIMMYSRYGANYGMPKEMEKEDIMELLSSLRKTVINVKKGGLDGVEIHACHAYLLGQFLSPLTNRRTDEYGGNLRNRMRLLMECIDVTREVVGVDMAVGVRISGDEFTPGGLTIEDNKLIAKAIEDTGKVDYISVSGGSNWTVEGTAGIAAPSFVPPGFLVPLAAEIKKTVSLPVFCAGRINDPVLAEKILAEGQADMIGMARPLLADSELPKKAMEGREDDIRPCVGCMQGCMSRFLRGLPITCVHNPAGGKEKRMGIGTLKPAQKVKKVMVIGAGPAGLKAAEVSAQRNHEVVLYEKEYELGGQVRLAALTPSRREFGNITDYLSKQVRKLGIKINVGQEVTTDTVFTEKPDVVIVATGCEPLKNLFDIRKFTEKQVKGINQSNVISVWDTLQGKVDIGQNVLIADGEGHYRTLAVADYLAGQGKKVHILTPTRILISDVINTIDGLMIFRELRRKGVIFSHSTMIREISGDRVITSSQGNDTIEGIDTVIWAMGCRAVDRLYFALKGMVKELYRVGDCVAPRLIDSAIWEGEMVGRKI
ncbi:FAD-dependent oxidoreductase [Chloroflexota bacterium]